MVYFIVNPSAGSGKAKAAVQVIERSMRENNMDFSVVYTNAPGDFDRVSGLIDYNKAKSIVCVGGDGTIQEYVGLAINRDINFGIIPAGSGNDLILSTPLLDGKQKSLKSLKFSNFDEKILFYARKIIGNKTIYVDAVSININSINGKKYFFNIGGTGIDIQVLKDALPLKKFLGGGAYFISLIKNVFTYKMMEMKLTVDGEIEEDKFVAVAICNGSYYGGHMRICPPAIIDDGLITLCRIKSMPRLKMMTMFPLVNSGSHTKLKEVSFINCSSVKLEFDGKKIINLDGNLSEFESPITFEIVKNAVKLIV